MHVIVVCCACSRQLRLPKAVIGGTVRCPLCKAVFMTRALDDDRVEAIAVAEKPRPKPTPPPQTPKMELDDPPLVPTDDASDPVLDVFPVDEKEKERPSRKKKEPDRFELVGEREERRQREEDEEDEEREERPSKRRREGAALASFAVFIHHDPEERLRGRFSAEVDPEGLNLWRGKGRVLDVPAGSDCEYLGQGRLLLPIEGRKVELTPLHPDGLHDELAREVDGFLTQRQDTVTMPVRTRGPVVWMSLLPLLIPFLAVIFGDSIGGAVGFILWGVLGALLATACLLLTMQRNWSPGGRAWAAGLTSLVGFLALGIGLRIDASSDAPPPPATTLENWWPLAPVDSGFRVEMPGRPERRAGVLRLPSNTPNTYCVESAAPETFLAVAYGDTGVLMPPDQALDAAGQSLAQQNTGRIAGKRDLNVDGKKGREFQIDSSEKGKVVARAFVDGRRVFLIVFASRTLDPQGADATRYLDSFAFDPSTGWPPPGAPR